MLFYLCFIVVVVVDFWLGLEEVVKVGVWVVDVFGG